MPSVTTNRLSKSNDYGVLASLRSLTESFMSAHLQLQSERANSLTLAVVAASQAPLLLLDADLTIVMASRSFCRSFPDRPRRRGGTSVRGPRGGGVGRRRNSRRCSRRPPQATPKSRITSSTSSAKDTKIAAWSRARRNSTMPMPAMSGFFWPCPMSQRCVSPRNLKTIFCRKGRFGS